MRSIKKVRLSILIIVFLTGCDTSVEIKKKIEGTWTLEKIITTRRKFESSGTSEKLMFYDDGTYKQHSPGYDVLMYQEGFYDIENHSKRYFLILKGKVPPTPHGDTIRQHSSREIITISNDSLVLGYRMLSLHETFPGKNYNRVDYYIRER